MAKRKPDTGAIYISPRLRASLEPVGRCALTVVTAPMGYGKTTAVNWYLSQRAQEGPVHIVRVSVYSDNLAIFWKSVQDAFVHAGLDFLADCPCPTDDAGASLLSDDLCRAFASGQLLPVSQYLVGLENKRLKREQLQQLLEAGWRAAAEALLAAYGKPDPADIPGAEELRRGLTVRQLRGLTELMKRYCLECRYNVGVGHVLGALCAGWQELL